VNILERARAFLQAVVTRLSSYSWRRGIAVALVVGGGYCAAQCGPATLAVRLEINGLTLVHHTALGNAPDILAELEIALSEQDRAALPSDDALASGEPIRLTIATPVEVLHPQGRTMVYMVDGDLAAALEAGGFTLGPLDRLVGLNGPIDPAAGLAVPTSPPRVAPAAWVDLLRRPQTVILEPAVPLTVVDRGEEQALISAAGTVGEALAAAEIPVYQGDSVVPALDTVLTADLTITIDRAALVTLDADGRVAERRTRADSVEELLSEAGIVLEGEDRVSPEGSAAVAEGLRVSVVRVYDEYFVQEVPIPYETVRQGNPELEIDQRRTAQWGREGAMRQQVRVHYENGVEVGREEGESWVAREPEPRILEYGTGIVVRQLETPYGTLEYWRRLRMLATSYSAATAGTPRSSPYYGRTRLGEPARQGVIAVDPSVVALRQRMYVPGYGIGYAGDTGSGIHDLHIDLCYDDDNLVHWYRWVDVYLLTPAPPASQIAWTLPNSPVERE
jgi:uncharacterized protein YabE (DUF348 family)